MKRLGLFLAALTLVVGLNTANASINVDSLKNEIVKNSKEIQEQRKDSIMVSKLSANQLIDLKREELEIQKQRTENEGRSNMPFNGFELFMICLLPFLFVAIIIYIGLKAKREESKRRYDLYSKSLEMGQSVPEHFFDEPKKANPSSNLKRGILWLVIGLGLSISFIVMQKQNDMIAGIVPTFVGIGYLLVHFLDKPKTNSTGLNDGQHG